MEITKERWFKLAVGLILFLVTVWLLNEVKFIFTPLVIFVQTLFLPFLMAGILFYICRPLIQTLEKLRVPRTVAILLIFLLIVGVLVLIVALIGPIVQDQFVRLINNIPKMIQAVQDGVVYWQQNQANLPPYVKDVIYNIGGKLENIFLNTGLFLGRTIGNVFSFIFALVVVPFILFYLLRDREKVVPNVVRFFPQNREAEIRHILGDMDRALASYIQGQLTVSTCVGVMLLLGYMIIGLDYALLLALVGMVTNVIPFLGPFLAVTPAIVVAWFQKPVMVLYVIVVMVVAQQIESNLISPQVMGRALNVHPLTIILLILVGGNLAGLLGMILIIPIYAVAKVIVQHLYRLLSLRGRTES